MLQTSTKAVAPAPPWAGAAPEAWSPGTLLARALDEVDFGIVLLADDGEVMHLNHRARHALRAGQGLQLTDNRLRTSAATRWAPGDVFSKRAISTYSCRS